MKRLVPLVAASRIDGFDELCIGAVQFMWIDTHYGAFMQ
jgi:hypothetical protein